MSEDLRLLPPPSAPLDVAKLFAIEKCTQQDALTLRYWRGGWWTWTGTCFVELHRDRVRKSLYEFTASAEYKKDDGDGGYKLMPWLPNKRRVDDLIDALKGVCFTTSEIAVPCWLDGRRTGMVVACENGLLDPKARVVLQHTPLFFNTFALPFAYDPSAECPVWESFMRDLWGEDDEPPAALEEMLGAAVAGKLDLHRILVIVGPPRAGKSLIAAVFEGLIGAPNTTWPRLMGLADDKVLSSLIGKALCLIADIRATGGKTPEIAEALLSISGGDSFTIDRKYKEAWVGALPVLLVMISNELPTLRDGSGALAGRYLPLILTKSFQGREDRTLKDRLLVELPGILNRALDGLERIEQRGQFSAPKASVEVAEDLADMASPMKRFVHERLEVIPPDANREDYTETSSKLLSAYNTWATENREEQINMPRLGQRLRSVVPQLQRWQPREADGGRGAGYSGVRLRQVVLADAPGGRAAMEALARQARPPIHIIKGGRDANG